MKRTRGMTQMCTPTLRSYVPNKRSPQSPIPGFTEACRTTVVDANNPHGVKQGHERTELSPSSMAPTWNCTSGFDFATLFNAAANHINKAQVFQKHSGCTVLGCDQRHDFDLLHAPLLQNVQDRFHGGTWRDDRQAVGEQHVKTWFKNTTHPSQPLAPTPQPRPRPPPQANGCNT